MSPKERVMKAREVLELAAFDARVFMDGNWDVQTFGALLERHVRRLNRACWCDEKVCCGVHQRHTSPHKRCMLR